jgi:hypothetical protein
MRPDARSSSSPCPSLPHAHRCPTHCWQNLHQNLYRSYLAVGYLMIIINAIMVGTLVYYVVIESLDLVLYKVCVRTATGCTTHAAITWSSTLSGWMAAVLASMAYRITAASPVFLLYHSM